MGCKIGVHTGVRVAHLDVHGWDFVNNKAIVIDNHGHGTHIAGIIGAVGGNGIGISGVSPKVSIMPLKYYDPTSKGNDNLKNTVRAIQYAVKKKVQIINYSGGGTEPDDQEFSAIKLARDNGILVVAAAGNERSNSDLAPYYPADYSLDNIISVTAINTSAQVLASSNYGSKSVHIAAPGENIYSTLPNGQFGLMTGTSQATAFVTGVAALILSHNKEFNYAQVKKQIISTADELPELRGKTSTSGKLNSYAALAIQPNIAATGINSANTNQVNIGVMNSVDQVEPLSNSNAGLLTDLVQALKASVKVTQKQPQQPQRKNAASEEKRL
jgi:subtilisin family serine protease